MENHDVGKRMLFANENIRVWDMELAPGESSHEHTHLADYIFIYVAPSEIELFVEGESQGNIKCDDGFVQYTEVGSLGLPAHAIQNRGDRNHRQIIVEILGPSRSETPVVVDNGLRDGVNMQRIGGLDQ